MGCPLNLYYLSQPEKVEKMGKKAISATIDESLERWIEQQIKDTKRFRNRSHLIEIALSEMKQRKETDEKK